MFCKICNEKTNTFLNTNKYVFEHCENCFYISQTGIDNSSPVILNLLNNDHDYYCKLAIELFKDKDCKDEIHLLYIGYRHNYMFFKKGIIGSFTIMNKFKIHFANNLDNLNTNYDIILIDNQLSSVDYPKEFIKNLISNNQDNTTIYIIEKYNRMLKDNFLNIKSTKFNTGYFNTNCMKIFCNLLDLTLNDVKLINYNKIECNYLFKISKNKSSSVNVVDRIYQEMINNKFSKESFDSFKYYYYSFQNLLYNTLNLHTLDGWKVISNNVNCLLKVFDDISPDLITYNEDVLDPLEKYLIIVYDNEDVLNNINNTNLKVKFITLNPISIIG